MGKKFKLKVTEYNEKGEVVKEETEGRPILIQEAENYMRKWIIERMIFSNCHNVNISKDIKLSVKEAPDYECSYSYYDTRDDIIFISHAFTYDIIKQDESGKDCKHKASVSLVEVDS